MDAAGFEHDRHRTAVARQDSVIVRGSEQSGVGLCSGEAIEVPIREAPEDGLPPTTRQMKKHLKAPSQSSPHLLEPAAVVG